MLLAPADRKPIVDSAQQHLPGTLSGICDCSLESGNGGSGNQAVPVHPNELFSELLFEFHQRFFDQVFAFRRADRIGLSR